jgi:hypothetical protein
MWWVVGVYERRGCLGAAGRDGRQWVAVVVMGRQRGTRWRTVGGRRHRHGQALRVRDVVAVGGRRGHVQMVSGGREGKGEGRAWSAWAHMETGVGAYLG